MSETTIVDLTESFTKVADAGDVSFTIQNVGADTVVVVFTNAGPPAAGAPGLLLGYREGVSRDHGTGHVYARAANGQSRVVVVK